MVNVLLSIILMPFALIAALFTGALLVTVVKGVFTRKK